MVGFSTAFAIIITFWCEHGSFLLIYIAAAIYFTAVHPSLSALKEWGGSWCCMELLYVVWSRFIVVYVVQFRPNRRCSGQVCNAFCRSFRVPQLAGSFLYGPSRARPAVKSASAAIRYSTGTFN